MIALWLVVAAAWLGVYEAARAVVVGRGDRWPQWRRRCWWGSAALLAAVGLLDGLAHASGVLWVETLLFALLGFGVAPLTALGAPWALAQDLVRRRPSTPRRPQPPPSRLGARRLRGQPLLAFAGFATVTIAWRVPTAVDALARSRALLALEALTLVAGTFLLWATLVGSPPFASLEQPPGRIALAAASMWSVWIFAYAVGFSGHPFYPAYATGSSPIDAQELSVGVLWGASALALAPTIFVSLLRWLRAEQLVADAEAALYRRHPGPSPDADHLAASPNDPLDDP